MAMPVRYLVWALIGAPHLVLQALRQGLPLAITIIVDEMGGTTADKAFLLGAFYPGYCVAMLPGGFSVKPVGAKRLLTLGLGGTAALLAALPLAAGRATGGGTASPRALWRLWAVMCGMGALSAPLMPASSVIQQEWMPAWLGTERVWAIKIPMLCMKLGRTLTNLAIPLLTARFGWRGGFGVAYAVVTAAAAVAWQLGISETVSGCRMTDGERKILAAPPPSAAPAPPPPALAIRFAELADVGTLVGLINAAYASSEGELWEEGAGFQRISDRSELDGLIEKRQLYVAVPAATAWEGSAAGGGRCGEIAGCVATFPVGSTVGGVDATVLEFGLLCVAPEFKRVGLATRLVSHAEGVALTQGLSVTQCELLVPRDLIAHPHRFKEMMLRRFYPGFGYSPDRILPFEDAYPQVVASNTLNFDCDAVVFQKALSPNPLPLVDPSVPQTEEGGELAKSGKNMKTDESAAESIPTVSAVARMLRKPEVRAVVLAHTTTSTVNICFAQWAPTILIEGHSLSTSAAGALLATANAVDIGGQFLSGAFESALLKAGWSPRSVQRLCHSGGSVLHAVCMVGFTLAPSANLATLLYCITTATMGMVQSAFFGLYLDAGGKEVGLLMSIGNTVANFPGVVVPIAGAWLRQRYGSFAPLFGIVAAAHVLSAAVFRTALKEE